MTKLKNSVAGAVVDRSFPYPGRPNTFAVSAVWAGGSWSPGEEPRFSLLRPTGARGTWTIRGVESGPTTTQSPTVILGSDGPVGAPRPGDLMVAEGAAVSLFKVLKSSEQSQRRLPARIGEWLALTNVKDLDSGILAVFHPKSSHPKPGDISELTVRDRKISVEVEEYATNWSDNSTLELTIAASAAPIKSFMDLLTPIRDFVLNAGQELFEGRVRPSIGRRPASVSDMFEPELALAPGSIKLSVSAPARRVLLPDVSPDRPLRLLVAALSAAQQGNSQRVLRLLESEVLSTDLFINALLDLSSRAMSVGGVSVGDNHSTRRVELGQRVKDSLLECLSKVSTRRLRRDGDLYALNTYRGWLKVSTYVDGEKEDWQLKYSTTLKDQIIGHVPRRVSVVFDTKTPVDVRVGRGDLIGISISERKTTGIIYP